MKMKNITTTLSRMSGRTGLKLKKYSPEILLVVGIAGAVTSTVLACKATLKAEEVIDKHSKSKAEVDKVWDQVKEGDIALDEYSEKDHKKDLVIVYTHTAMDFVKLYGPAISLGLASYGCIIGGHGILKKRNIALMAAYKAVEESFNSYRQRVKDELGEETDYMYKHGLKAEEVTETEIGEDGKSKKVKKTKYKVEDPNSRSIYSKFFDSSCREWSPSPEYSMMYIKGQQNYFNNLLTARGHVFLNEVYDALGIDRTQAGSVVGWAIGEGNSNCIDFGIFDGSNERTRAFVNGYEDSILLDFNVDGVIFDSFTQAKA